MKFPPYKSVKYFLIDKHYQAFYSTIRIRRENYKAEKHIKIWRKRNTQPHNPHEN